MIADSKLQLLTQGGKWEGIQHLTKVFTNAFGEPLVSHLALVVFLMYSFR